MLPSRNTIPQSATISIDENFCLFGLRLYVPVNNFQSCRDGATASWVLPVLFGGGIDKNEQSDYLTCIQRKNRRSRL